MKRAIIIGATSGIGRELALLLVQNNYKVGITGRRKKLLEELQSQFPENIIYSCFDITSGNNSSYLSGLVSDMGGLDLLIFCSGVCAFNKELNFEIDKIAIQTNVLGFTEIIDWAYKYFQQQKHGHIVAISSIAGLRGYKFSPAYSASKAFQIIYLESLRQKSNNMGLPIYITDIRPGFVNTDMTRGKRKFWASSKEKAAENIFLAIKTKKEISYLSGRWSMIAFIMKYTPSRIHKKF